MKGKARQKRGEEEAKQAYLVAPEKCRGLSLRKEDWPVPVLREDDVRDGSEGVLLLDQATAEKLHKDLHNAGGKIALLSPKPIAGADERAREVSVKATTSADGLVVVKRWLTMIGEGRIKPTYEKTASITEVTVPLINNSVKVVLKVPRSQCDQALYAAMRKAPQASVDAWLERRDLRTHLLYMTRPLVKDLRGSEWIEAVLTIKKDALERFLRISGNEGVFLSLFRTKDDGHDYWKVVRFETDVTLEMAIEKASRHPDAAHGLVWGAWGIGVRIPVEGFANKVKKLFGEEVAKREVLRTTASLYELAQLPPWVEFDSVRDALGRTWNWEISLVRIARGWNTKKFVVRAAQPPPRDSMIIEDHWVPIQPAKPRQPAQIRRMQQKPTSTSMGPRIPGKTEPKEKQTRETVAQHQTSHPHGFESVLNRMFGRLWERVEERLASIEDRLGSDSTDEDEESDFEDADDLGDTGMPSSDVEKENGKRAKKSKACAAKKTRTEA